jgi:hypothetical protein
MSASLQKCGCVAARRRGGEVAGIRLQGDAEAERGMVRVTPDAGGVGTAVVQVGVDVVGAWHGEAVDALCLDGGVVLEQLGDAGRRWTSLDDAGWL